MVSGGLEVSTPFRPEGFDFHGQSALTGVRCLACGEHFFPPRRRCLCCGAAELAPVALARTGTVRSYTVVYRAPKGFEAPYACGWIQLPEGVTLWSLLRVPPERLRVGLEVALTFARIGDRTVYCFTLPGGSP